MRNGIMVWTCTLFFLMILNVSLGIIPSWAEEAGATDYDSTKSGEDTEDEDLSDEAIEKWLTGAPQGDTKDKGVEERTAGAELDDRVAKEKEWLRSEYKRINGLPMHLAMKKSKIKKLKDKLDLLKKSPEEYFRTNPQHNKNEDK